jgi:hypothetical protein
MDFGERHQVEEYLAQISEGGVIVEIGGGGGRGATSLANGTKRGANLPIYVIDPYVEYKDLLGGEYGPQTKALFKETTKDIDLTLIEQDALSAVQNWSESIALLWIDLTMNYHDLKPILDAWRPFVIMGGYIGITGLEYGHLGTRQIADEMQGFEHILEEQRFVACLRRTDYKRAVFYIVSGDDNGRYVREAQRSVGSVKKHLGLPCHLFLTGQTNEQTDMFDVVHTLPPRATRFWYLDSTRYFVQAVKQLVDYEQLLYLDVDTYICWPCLDLFDVLDEFDLAIAQSPQRDAIASTIGTPSAFSTLSIGVNVFRNTHRMRAFLDCWLARYEQHADLYDENDQSALRDELYENKNLRWLTLPPEYGLRFDLGPGLWARCGFCMDELAAFR